MIRGQVRMRRRREEKRDREVGILLAVDPRGFGQQTEVGVGLVRGPPSFATDDFESATAENC